MRSLYWYNPKILIKNGSYEEWTSLYKNLGFFHRNTFIDRLEVQDYPVKVSIPEYLKLQVQPYTNYTYEECMLIKAEKLWKLSVELNKPLCIFFSGGVDSTAALVALLRTVPDKRAKKNLYVLATDEMFNENPDFVRKYIIGQLNVSDAHNIAQYHMPNAIFVTGTYNGSTSVYTRSFGRYVTNPVKEVTDIQQFIYDYIIALSDQSKHKDYKYLDYWINIFKNIIDASPYNLSTSFQILWWLELVCFWQGVFFRWLSVYNAKQLDKEFVETSIQHFYEDRIFQDWAINNICISPTFGSMYKELTKRFIYEFDHNDDYFYNKGKSISLRPILRYQKYAWAIDTDYNLIHDEQEALNLILDNNHD